MNLNYAFSDCKLDGTEARKVMVVYSEVNAAEGKYGLILKPSPPHIKKKGVSFLLTKE